MMTADRKVIGVVLAGGLSSRMGTDKAMLPCRGRTLLQQQVALLAPLCVNVVVSGEYDGFECVSDAVERCGPLGGMYSVALQYPESALLVLAVDMLQIAPAQLTQLMLGSAACHFANQPLPAFFPDTGALLAVIQRMFAEPALGFSLRRLHSMLSSTAIIDAEFEPKNINTMADWQGFG